MADANPSGSTFMVFAVGAILVLAAIAFGSQMAYQNECAARKQEQVAYSRAISAKSAATPEPASAAAAAASTAAAVRVSSAPAIDNENEDARNAKSITTRKSHRRSAESKPHGVPTVSADPRIFDYTKELDPLAANDIDPRSLFPTHSNAPPKNAAEAMARVYDYDNFRRAMVTGLRSGFLKSEYDGRAWNDLPYQGMLCNGRTVAQAWTERFRSDPTLMDRIEGSMVPIPEQVYDFAYEQAVTAGVMPQHPTDGIGADAVFHMMQRRDKGHPVNDPARNALFRKLVAQVQQTIPAAPHGNAGQAAGVMNSMADAYTQARKEHMALPVPTSKNLTEVSNWMVSSDSGAQAAARRLADAAAVPLGPARVRASA